jgi:hypothetical protein
MQRRAQIEAALEGGGDDGGLPLRQPAGELAATDQCGVQQQQTPIIAVAVAVAHMVVEQLGFSMAVARRLSAVCHFCDGHQRGERTGIQTPTLLIS